MARRSIGNEKNDELERKTVEEGQCRAQEKNRTAENERKAKQEGQPRRVYKGLAWLPERVSAASFS